LVQVQSPQPVKNRPIRAVFALLDNHYRAQK